MNLPHSYESERAILGSALLDNAVLAQACQIVSPEDFFSPRTRKVYDAMLAMFATTQVIDIVTLVEALRARHDLDACGGPPGVSELLDGIPRAANVESWARIVKDKAVLRKLILTASEIQRIASDGTSAGEALESAQAEILKVSMAARAFGGFHAPDAVAKRTISMLEVVNESKDGISGLRTGITEFDIKTGGLRPGQLAVFAARPGMGKTAAATTISDNVTMRGGKVAFFSLEMEAEEITERRFASRSGQNTRRLNAVSSAWGHVAKVFPKISSESFFISDEQGQPLSQIRMSARRLHQEKGGLDLVVVDYIGLAVPERGNERASEYELVTKVARGLKNLAKELKVPVLALCQLNRDLEKRPDKRPMLSDLRSSGEIEQAADIVTFLYRPWAYDKTADPREAHWFIAKQRQGPTGSVEVRFIPEIQAFEDKPDERESV